MKKSFSSVKQAKKAWKEKKPLNIQRERLAVRLHSKFNNVGFIKS